MAPAGRSEMAKLAKLVEDWIALHDAIGLDSVDDEADRKEARALAAVFNAPIADLEDLKAALLAVKTAWNCEVHDLCPCRRRVFGYLTEQARMFVGQVDEVEAA